MNFIYYCIFQNQLIDLNNIETLQEVTNDEVIYGMTLTFNEISITHNGAYTCVISNHYGMLSKTINIKVGKSNLDVSIGDTERWVGY